MPPYKDAVTSSPDLTISSNISNQWEPALKRWKYGISVRQRQHLDWTHAILRDYYILGTDTLKSVSYLDLHLEIENGGRLKTKLHDKCDYSTLSSPSAKLEGWYGSRVDTRDDMENFMS
jgi:ribosome modulation factor